MEKERQSADSKVKATCSGLKRSSTSDIAPRAKQAAVSTFLQKPVSQSQPKSVNDGLMYLVSNGMQSVSIVEDKGFIEYSKRLNASYCLPTRKTLSKWIGDKTKQV